nr:DNA-binding domain-containing protein [Erwinia oleae]
MAIAVPAPENEGRLQPEINGGIEPVGRGLTAKGYEDEADAEAVAPPGEPKPVEIHRPEDVLLTVQTPAESDRHAGKFWQWLSDGLITGEIPVNTPGARVHLVSGFVFITVPGIFYLYLKSSGLESNQREALQEDFERLEKHRRVKGKRFYFSHLYESSDHSGPFKRTKGYLIKAGLLYRGKSVPDDSPVLVIP